MREIGKKVTSGRCFTKTILMIREKIMRSKMLENMSTEKRFKDFP